MEKPLRRQPRKGGGVPTKFTVRNLKVNEKFIKAAKEPTAFPSFEPEPVEINTKIRTSTDKPLSTDAERKIAKARLKRYSTCALVIAKSSYKRAVPVLEMSSDPEQAVNVTSEEDDSMNIAVFPSLFLFVVGIMLIILPASASVRNTFRVKCLFYVIQKSISKEMKLGIEFYKDPVQRHQIEGRDYWDNIQSKFKCCGLDAATNETGLGWTIWGQIDETYRGKIKVPKSCCPDQVLLSSLRRCQTNPSGNNSYINMDCLQAVMDLYGWVPITLGGIALSFCIIMCALAVTTYVYLRRIH